MRRSLMAVVVLASVGCASGSPEIDTGWEPRMPPTAVDGLEGGQALVTLELRSLRVGAELARSWAGPADQTRVVHLPRPRLLTILEEEGAVSRGSRGGPRVTVFSGQPADVRSASEARFVKDYQLSSAGGGGASAEPVYGTVEEGFVWRVTPRVLEDGRVRLAMSCQLTERREPMEVREYAWEGRRLEVQVPRLYVTRQELDLTLDDGGVVLVALPAPQGSEVHHLFLVKADVTRIREEGGMAPAPEDPELEEGGAEPR